MSDKASIGIWLAIATLIGAAIYLDRAPYEPVPITSSYAPAPIASPTTPDAQPLHRLPSNSLADIWGYQPKPGPGLYTEIHGLTVDPSCGGPESAGLPNCSLEGIDDPACFNSLTAPCPPPDTVAALSRRER